LKKHKSKEIEVTKLIEHKDKLYRIWLEYISSLSKNRHCTKIMRSLSYEEMKSVVKEIDGKIVIKKGISGYRFLIKQIKEHIYRKSHSYKEVTYEKVPVEKVVALSSKEKFKIFNNFKKKKKDSVLRKVKELIPNLKMKNFTTSWNYLTISHFVENDDYFLNEDLLLEEAVRLIKVNMKSIY